MLSKEDTELAAAVKLRDNLAPPPNSAPALDCACAEDRTPNSLSNDATPARVKPAAPKAGAAHAREPKVRDRSVVAAAAGATCIITAALGDRAARITCDAVRMSILTVVGGDVAYQGLAARTRTGVRKRGWDHLIASSITSPHRAVLHSS